VDPSSLKLVGPVLCFAPAAAAAAAQWIATSLLAIRQTAIQFLVEFILYNILL